MKEEYDRDAMSWTDLTTQVTDGPTDGPTNGLTYGQTFDRDADVKLTFDDNENYPHF